MSKIAFPIIVHNTEQDCGFGSALPPEEPHITPGGNHWSIRWRPVIAYP